MDELRRLKASLYVLTGQTPGNESVDREINTVVSAIEDLVDTKIRQYGESISERYQRKPIRRGGRSVVKG